MPSAEARTVRQQVLLRKMASLVISFRQAESRMMAEAGVEVGQITSFDVCAMTSSWPVGI